MTSFGGQETEQTIANKSHITIKMMESSSSTCRHLRNLSSTSLCSIIDRIGRWAILSSLKTMELSNGTSSRRRKPWTCMCQPTLTTLACIPTAASLLRSWLRCLCERLETLQPSLKSTSATGLALDTSTWIVCLQARMKFTSSMPGQQVQPTSLSKLCTTTLSRFTRLSKYPCTTRTIRRKSKGVPTQPSGKRLWMHVRHRVQANKSPSN